MILLLCVLAASVGSGASDQDECDLNRVYVEEAGYCMSYVQACSKYSNVTGCDEYCKKYPNYYQCEGGNGFVCILPAFVCDGSEDCKNGDDEESGQDCAAVCRGRGDGEIYLNEDKRCAGVGEVCGRGLEHLADCDEYCEQRGYFRCNGGNGPACINERHVCDGHKLCAHGNDEDPEMCASRNA